MPKVAVDQGCLIPIPAGLPAEIGTLIEPLSCCVNGMRYQPLERSEHVLIFGGGTEESKPYPAENSDHPPARNPNRTRAKNSDQPPAKN